MMEVTSTDSASFTGRDCTMSGCNTEADGTSQSDCKLSCKSQSAETDGIVQITRSDVQSLSGELGSPVSDSPMAVDRDSFNPVTELQTSDSCSRDCDSNISSSSLHCPPNNVVSPKAVRSHEHSSLQSSKRNNYADILQSIDTQEFNSQNSTAAAESQQHEVAVTQFGTKRKKIRRSVLPKQPKYLCHFCGELMNCPSHFERHINVHENIKPFLCATCGHGFSRKGTMAFHIWRSHTSRPYNCCGCHRAYRTPKDLLTHLRFFHHYEKPPATTLCDICGKLLRTDSVRSHWVNVHSEDAKKRDWTCGICSKSFQSKDILKRHQEGHQRRAYKCFECNAEYPVADRLRLHVQLHFLSANNVIPPKSAKPLNFRQMFLAARRQDSKPAVDFRRQFACSQCGITFQRMIDAKVHADAHSGMRPFCCADCNRAFTTKSQLKDHMAHIHSGVRQFACQFCRLSFAVIRELRRHMKKRHDCSFAASVTSQQFSPDAGPNSGKQPTVESRLTGKSSVSEPEQATKPVSSDTTPRKCSTSTQMDGTDKRQFATRVGEPEQATKRTSGIAPGKRSKRTKVDADPEWQVTEERKRMRRTRKWPANRTCSSGKQNFPCSQCAKTFETKIALGDHVTAVHSGVRAHACRLCERRFAVARELVRHVKTKHAAETAEEHFGRTSSRSQTERKFSCNQCAESFRTKIVLADHEAAVHSGDQAHACRLCKRTFAVARDLSRHIKMKHPPETAAQRYQRLQAELTNCSSEKRPFACSRCAKSFQTKIALGDHAAAVHSGVRAHACNLCERRFAVARELTRHVKTKHAAETVLGLR